MQEVGCRCRACPACGVVWLGDCKVMSLAASEVMPDAVCLITVTAPGKGRLMHCPRTGKVTPRAARNWNRTAPQRWRSLWLCGSRRGRRIMADGGERFRLLARAWEYQRRGVLHVHLILPFATPLERDAAYQVAADLSSMAGQFDWGFVDRGKMTPNGDGTWSRKLEEMSGNGAARYLCAYLTSTGAGKEGIAEVARKQGVPGPVLYVADELKRESGVSMRTLRNRRRVLATFGMDAATVDDWQVACTLDALQAGVAPFDDATEDLLREALERPRDALEGVSGSVRLCDEHGVVIEPTPAPAPRSLERLQHFAVHCRSAWAQVRLDLVSHRDPTTEFYELHLSVELLRRWVSPPPAVLSG